MVEEIHSALNYIKNHYSDSGLFAALAVYWSYLGYLAFDVHKKRKNLEEELTFTSEEKIFS